MDARAALLSSRNPDGGWGYYPGKSSRLEPTSWALLALDERPDLINKWRREGPWRVDVPGGPINYAFQALAGLVLLRHASSTAEGVAIASALVGVKGLALEQADAIRQDNSLQAWPWIDNTFSWVEPTCLALLLLKKCRSLTGATLPGLPAGGAERIAVGERMLVDRVCAGGGWNYGGSNVFGQNLLPYVPTTAWGILALQDRPNDPAVVQSVARLKQEASTEPTAQALALTAIALRAVGVSDSAHSTLLAKEVSLSPELRNNVGLAMTVYALERTKGGHAFAL